MKSNFLWIFFIPFSFYSCKHKDTTTLKSISDRTQILLIDSSYRDTIKQHIKFRSDKHFSQFNTPLKVYFLTNDLKTDSIIDREFKMISWYSIQKDTIDLVAHIGEFETEALLLRFVKGKTTVRFYRAPHLSQNYFRLNLNDSFSNQIEVPPLYYRLELAEIPDTINKQVIYGHIEMKSRDYYDKRDSANNRHEIQMSFYFRSQYRNFDY